MPRHDPNDLGSRVYKALAGRSVNTEPATITEAVGWFLRAAQGNVSAAARLAGVPRRSMRDWVSGVSKPRGARAAGLIDSARLSERRNRLGPVRERRWRAAGGDGAVHDIVLTGAYNYDPGTSDREPITISKYMEPDAGDQLVSAYLAGAGPDGLREKFAELITDSPFYAETMALPPGAEHGWTVSNLTLG